MKTTIAVRAASRTEGRSSLRDATRTSNEGNTRAIEAIAQWLERATKSPEACASGDDRAVKSGFNEYWQQC